MEPAGNIILRCERLSRSFTTPSGTDYRVLGDVSFDVRENEFLVLFGPGQCGKTTLLNLLAGLDQPTGGFVEMQGEPVHAPSPSRGVVYQTTSLFPWLTVMGNVEFGPASRGIPKAERRKQAQYFIDLVGLKGFEKSYPNQLSGGMQQRAGIARAYCSDPSVLLMDEPFGHLDAQTRYMMEQELERIWRAEKRTVLFVTNNIEEALYLADRIILLTNCPSVICKEYMVNLPRPRNYVDPAFLQLRKEITREMDPTQ